MSSSRRRRLPVLLSLLLLAACTPAALSDTPDGMLAPFPADAAGNAVPFEQMVPALVEQAVALAVAPAAPPHPPLAPQRGLELLADLRNEPILVLTPRGAFGISAPWPTEKDWTLRPPTRDELLVVPFGPLDATTPYAAWVPALAWLDAEAKRPRPGVQRFSGAVLLLAAGPGPAADPRAAAAVLTRLGAVRRARVVVVGPDGRFGAVPLPAATLPVLALKERARRAPGMPRREPLDGLPAPGDAPAPSGERTRFEAVLAAPIPGPRCLEAHVTSDTELAAALAPLVAGGPHDELSVSGLDPTLHRYLHPEEVVPAALAERVHLDDRCAP